ncbi:twin-arginine translocation protein, TatA/E family subunit [Ammonifex degensii KC4]|uniref:Sec-independent protein translocase protein TatA n=1 Tax=Ammonifex degensii (strain DSM 10501 / KC4) TaxID=429009 RepID=C9R7R2_AMMDK|nr:twin-arginine translocase TatA/TatE family subunit [Ammonifex degensii]ACX52341.1 twin-arginine translocation protein, TatA/E family subunit [Ammonifex degensii KC4]
MFGLGPQEIILILAIALIIFGPSKLPELGRSLGKTIREFRKSTQDIVSDLKSNVDEVKKEVEEVSKSIKG